MVTAACSQPANEEPAPAPPTPETAASADTAPIDTGAEDPADASGGSKPASSDPPEVGAWSIQIGTERADTTFGVSAAPNGDVVVAAATEGSLAGDNQGKRDVYLARYSQSGELRWSVQTGGPQNDSPLGVSVGPDGSIYVGGFTDGDFASPNQGSADVWLARFDADGNEQWRWQGGTAGADTAFEMRLAGQFIVATGTAAGDLARAGSAQGERDAVLVWLDLAGNLVEIEQFGSDDGDDVTGLDVAADGAVVWSGYTFGSFEGAGAGEADLLLGRWPAAR